MSGPSQETMEDRHTSMLMMSALALVKIARENFQRNGHDATEIRLPILAQGMDLRVTIACGPRVEARNAIEFARLQASGQPIKPTVDMTTTIERARVLLRAYAERSAELIALAPDVGVTDAATVGSFQVIVDTCREVEKELEQVERFI